MTDEPELAPEEGAQALFGLIDDIGEAAGAGDLDGLNGILDRMEGIVAATGVEIPGLTDRVAAIKGQGLKAREHFENVDAALWAGDLQRARMLNMSGPELDMAALHGDALALDEAEDISPDLTLDGEEGFGEDAEFDLADFAAGIGVDLDDASIEDDPYADIAEGAPGAIDALIASGADLNAPGGPSQHTPLLAALDAPGRSAGDLKKLIDAGADPMVLHAEGDNAISWAMGYHHPETVTPDGERALIALLVAHGADVNHVIPGQMTALQRAIIQAGPVHVAALLAHGADASVDMFADFEPAKLARATLVMQAAAKPEVLAVMLDHGIDGARRDAHGRAPLDFIRQEAEAARARVNPDDEWTVDHAEALEISLGLLERHLAM